MQKKKTAIDPLQNFRLMSFNRGYRISFVQVGDGSTYVIPTTILQYIDVSLHFYLSIRLSILVDTYISPLIYVCMSVVLFLSYISLSSESEDSRKGHAHELHINNYSRYMRHYTSHIIYRYNR